MIHLTQLKSDHCPLLLKVKGDVCRKQYERPFRFFAPWVTNDEFLEVVKEAWIIDRSRVDNVGDFKKTIKIWNKEVFGLVEKQKHQLLVRLEGIQKSSAYPYS